MTKIIGKRVIHLAILALLGIAFSAFAGEDKRTDENRSISPQAPREIVETPDPRKQGELNEPILQQRNPRYRLRYGDVLELKFAVTPEFDQNVTVQPDGYIPLLRLEDLHVEGKTKSELDEALRKAYSKILRDPVITVKILEFEKPYFIAGGQVERPGKYDMRGNTTVAQAVSIAGGLTDAAKNSQILLFRRVSDEWVSVTEVDLKKMFNKGDLTEDLELRPGDMVFVPKSFMSKIKAYMPRADALVWLGIGRRTSTKR